MIGLDRLMKVKGVVATGQFSEDGRLIRKAGDVPDRLLEAGAALCRDQRTRIASYLDAFRNSSSMDWTPYIGSAVWGGKYTMIVMGCTFVFVEAKYVDVNELMVDLLECGPTGPRQMNQ